MAYGYAETVSDLTDYLGEEWANDSWGQQLLELGYYSRGNLSGDLADGARHALENYMLDEYNLDWDEWFDWDEWREWYENAA